jgi:acetoin utilization deacetylase AcuC-like enzyme
MKKFALIYSSDLEAYDLGHVLTRDRYGRFMDLFERTLGTCAQFQVVAQDPASDSDLLRIHTPEYLQRIERCESRDPHDTP